MAAGLGSGNMDTTTKASFIPALWGAKLNDFYRANLVAAKFFEDLSDEVVGGGNIIYIPNISQMTANTKTQGSAVTLNDQTDGKVTLTINTWKEVSFLVEDIVAAFMMRSYRMQERWMKNAAYTVASTLETSLLNLCRGFSQTVGTSALSFNDSEIRQAIAYLDAANVPQEDRAFFLHPNVVWNQLMGINKYTLAINTAGADPVTKGPIATLYGIPIYVTSNLAVYLGHRDGMLAGRDALNWAASNLTGGTQNGPVRLQTQYVQEYLGTLVTADIIYGVIENRDTSGVWIKAKSS
jgi:hypothetical protein